MKKPENKRKQPQDTPSATRRRKPPPPKPPAWNQEKAMALAKKGVGPTDIAAMVGVHRTTVSDYLKRVMPEFEALHLFRDRLGETFSLSLAHLTDLEHKLLVLLNDEDFLSTLTPLEKERLLGRVTVAKGIVYDKLRLHEGKSTSNDSHQIQLTQVHATLPFPTVNPTSSGSE